MLAVTGISVRRGGRDILRDVSLRVVPGEVHVLLGPNGSGKSTLLHTLAGSLVPDAGSVTLADRPLSLWPRRELARRRAVLSQELEIGFPMRAFEVVELGCCPHADSRKVRLARLQHALVETDAVEFAERLYPTLSGGEKQRVQLARVLAQIWPGANAGAPATAAGSYLLLDEPTNNLDLAHQHHTMRILQRLATRGLGVLCVVHDPNLGALYADRISLLKDGVLAASGTPHEVLHAENIFNVFDIPVQIVSHPTCTRPQLLAL